MMTLHKDKPQRKMSPDGNHRNTKRLCGCFAWTLDCLDSLCEEKRYEDIIVDAYKSLQKDTAVCESYPAVFYQVGFSTHFHSRRRKVRSASSIEGCLHWRWNRNIQSSESMAHRYDPLQDFQAGAPPLEMGSSTYYLATFLPRTVWSSGGRSFLGTPLDPSML